jgi:hypothetical protein
VSRRLWARCPRRSSTARTQGSIGQELIRRGAVARELDQAAQALAKSHRQARNRLAKTRGTQTRINPEINCGGCAAGQQDLSSSLRRPHCDNSTNWRPVGTAMRTPRLDCDVATVSHRCSSDPRRPPLRGALFVRAVTQSAGPKLSRRRGEIGPPSGIDNE